MPEVLINLKYFFRTLRTVLKYTGKVKPTSDIRCAPERMANCIHYYYYNFFFSTNHSINVNQVGGQGVEDRS